jgi:hypothetical protein
MPCPCGLGEAQKDSENCRAVIGRSAVPDAVPAAWSRPFSKGLPDLVSKALEPWQLLLITHFSENGLERLELLTAEFDTPHFV